MKQPNMRKALISVFILMLFFISVFYFFDGNKDDNKVTGDMVKVSGMAECFLPTTPITLADGTKKQIQDIKPGDKVLSYDLENNMPVISTVLNTYSHIEHDYLIINDRIKVTPYHYVYAKRKR